MFWRASFERLALSGLATFWRGPLPGLIRACLATFPAQGAPLTLFSYERDLGLPRGIEWRDAREICPDPGLSERYRVDGRVSLATFSDRFRYEMLTRTGYCWVDADFVALRPWRGFDAPVVWGRQPEAKGKALINNAVLRLPPEHPVLKTMLARARAAEGAEIGWGALGPYLLTEIAEAEGVYETSSPPERFYPVDPDEFWNLVRSGLARSRRRRRRRAAAPVERIVAPRRLRLRCSAAARRLPL